MSDQELHDAIKAAKANWLRLECEYTERMIAREGGAMSDIAAECVKMKYIEAIKHFRAKTGCGLFESKCFIDNLGMKP